MAGEIKAAADPDTSKTSSDVDEDNEIPFGNLRGGDSKPCRPLTSTGAEHGIR